MRPLILVLCENKAHFISLAERSNACNLRNNPWDGFYEIWQRLTKEIRRKTWQFLVSLATEGIGWNGKILTNCSMPFYFYMFQPIRIPLISHITAAPPPKSTAPMGCPSCWPEVAPADPVTRPFQWDMLDVFKWTLVPPEALAHSCGRDTECLNKGIAQASFKQGQSSQAWHGLRVHTNR